MVHLGSDFKMRFLAFLLFLFLAPAVFAAGGYTLDEDLLYRINFGSAEDIRLLLEKGANPNAHSRQGESALIMAIDRNDAETLAMVKVLVDKGASIETPDRSGSAPIINAAKYGQIEVVKILLAQGADFNVKSPNGTPLVEIARLNGKPELVRAIQEAVDKETAYAESLRSPERFKEIVKLYALDSCVYQYWNFFLTSRQAPERDDETKKKIEQVKHSLYLLIKQIQKYYTSTSTEALQKVSSSAVQEIYDMLQAMISNQNRAENGVGRDEDAKNRCEKIVEALNIDFVPVMNPNIPSAASSGAAGNAPPLPMGPADMTIHR